MNEEVEILKIKTNRNEKLNLEIKEKLKEVEVWRGKAKAWEIHNEQVMAFKAKLENEMELLRSKAARYEAVALENAHLHALNAMLTSEIEEEKLVQKQMKSRNAELEMENKRNFEEVDILTSKLQGHLCKQPVSMPINISPPQVSESEMAAKVKLQRLEKEQKETEKSLQGVQVKVEEVEKTNKKLNDQAHEYRMVIMKLKEELQDVKQKASMLDTSQTEVKPLRQQSEGSDLAKKQIKELEQQLNLIIESKVLVEDERNVLQSKLENISTWEDDRDKMREKIEALEHELDNSSRRLQELNKANAQNKIVRDRMEMEIKDLMEEIERARHPPVVLESLKELGKLKEKAAGCSECKQVKQEMKALKFELQSIKERDLQKEISELKQKINEIEREALLRPLGRKKHHGIISKGWRKIKNKFPN